MVKAKDVCDVLERFAPLQWQESYDNSGLIVGSKETELLGVLCTLDVTEDVVDEAIEKKCNMIVSHHPLIFRGLKSLTGKNNTERTLLKAIEKKLVVYACHTNLDKAIGGVSWRMAQKMGLKCVRVLAPEHGELMKLQTFVPVDHSEKVKRALYEITEGNWGVGHIGNYDHCSYRVRGTGTFRPGDGSHPFTGENMRDESVVEDKVELILPKVLMSEAESVLRRVHPYEEPAYDFFAIENEWKGMGLGVIGEFENTKSLDESLEIVKQTFCCKDIRYVGSEKQIKNVALCGGSGAELINVARSKGADLYVTADCKYHDLMDAEGEMIVASIGHYESEQYTKEVLQEEIIKKIPNFAVYISERNTNPIKHF